MTIRELGESYVSMGERMKAMDPRNAAHLRGFIDAAADSHDTALGAAAMLCYLRDLLTHGAREMYTRESLLVILEQIAHDPEIFPLRIGETMYAMENDSEPTA